MRSVTVRLDDLRTTVLNLGFAGENEHTQIRIDSKKMFDQYPTASPSLTVCPPEGESYPAVIERDGDFVLWTITDSDLVHEGSGEIQLSFTVSETVAKSYPGRFKVSRSIVSTGEIPEGIDDFLTRAGAALTAIPETIDEALADAKASGEFDGPPGYSPTATVSKSGKTATITITDKNGTTTAQISDGEDGGTSDYSDLENKPQIAGVTLSGNVSLHDLGAAAESDIPDPTSIIDDTAGDGDTNKVWSADKSSSLLTEINSKMDEPSSEGTNGQVLTTDGNGGRTWTTPQGGTVDPSAIASAVATWCNDNITDDPTVVIDKSLSVDGAAADSKAVGDEIKDITGNEKIAYTADGKWIDLSGTTANPSSPSSHNSYRYALVSCSAGDKFTITAKGSSSARAWGFIDSSNNILSVETSTNSSSGVTKKLITAPAGATYLIINDKYFGVSYKGNLVSNKIGNLPDDASTVLNTLGTQVANLEKYTKYYEPYTGWEDSDITVESGYITSDAGASVSNNNYRRTSYIPVNVGDKFDYYLWGNNNTLAVVYGYDANKIAVANSGIAGTSNVYSVGTYTVPSGVTYIRFCSKLDHLGTFRSQTGLKERTYSTGIIGDIQNEITKHPFISVFFDNFNQSNTDWVDSNSAWTFDYTNRTVTSTATGSVLGSNALVLNRKYIADMRIMSLRIKFGTNTVFDIGFRNADGTYDGSNKVTIDTANHRIKLYGYYNSTSQTYPLLIEKDISGFTISTDKWYMVKVERNRLNAIISITDHITGESVELNYTFTDGFFFDELYTFALVSGGNVVIADFDVSIMDRPYIYVVGDSITAYACAVGGWVQKFNKDLGNRLVVSGRGSDTASSIATLFDTEVKYIKPEIVMCCHGHNGGISATTIGNIKTLCDEIGCKLYINHITCQAEDRQIERNAVIEVAGCRGARFDIATARDGIPYVVPGDSAIRADSTLYKDTNVHPNLAGYQKMYDRLRIDVPELFNQ